MRSAPDSARVSRMRLTFRRDRRTVHHAGRSCVRTPPSISCLPSRSATPPASSVTGSADASGGPARRESPDARRRSRRAALARGRAVVACARSAKRTRLLLGNPACGNRLGAPCARTCELRLDRSRRARRSRAGSLLGGFTARPAPLGSPAGRSRRGRARRAACGLRRLRACFRVAPLNRYDAWAIWALEGHALYAFGWADPCSSPAPPTASRISITRCCCRPSKRSTFARWTRSTHRSCTSSSSSSWWRRCWRCFTASNSHPSCLVTLLAVAVAPRSSTSC